MKYLDSILLTSGETGFIASELSACNRWLVMIEYNLRWVDVSEIITT